MKHVIAIIFAILAVIVLAISSGPVALSLSDIAQALIGQGDSLHRVIIWDIRLPRTMAAFATGAALGASGAALQGLFRNPLAEPGTLGISACGTLTATLALYFGLAGSSMAVTIMAALGGSLLATFVLSAIALRTRSIATLLLFGIGLSSLAGAIMALALNFAPTPFTLADLINWTLGTVANRSWYDLLWCTPLILGGIGLLLTQARALSVLGLGEAAAHGMGVDLTKTRMIIVLGAGLATGASVALAGAIGFVGIVAPHLVRPWVGHDPGRAILPSALLGGGMLILADFLIRLLPTPTELKLGVLTALIGAPVFIWIIAHRPRGDA